MSKKKNNYEGIIISVSFFVVVITIGAFHFNGYFDFSIPLATDKLGHFGDFIGGFLGTILTIIATIYVYKTFHSQKKELKSQKKELKLQRQLVAQQQFENTFFNMLNVHRELKNDLKITSFDFFFKPEPIDYDEKFNGVEVFEKISNEYKEIYIDLMSLCYNYDSIRLGIINDKIIDPNFINSLNEDEGNLKPLMLVNQLEGNWDENNNSLDTHFKKIIFTYDLLFANYQNILSHYCRNVYHILKFIRKSEEEDKFEKHNKTNKYKQYANIFQSQLNVDEQFILFYNFIWHNINDQDEMFHPINIVNHYDFLDNLGIHNLIFEKHELFYEFVIKGSNRTI